MTDKKQTTLEKWENSIGAMSLQVLTIMNSVLEFELSCRSDPSNFTKETWRELHTVYDMVMEDAKNFQMAEINFRDALDALDDEKEAEKYGCSTASESDIFDMIDTIEEYYHEAYQKYFETYSMYQCFVRDYKLPRLDVIEKD